MKKLDLEKRHSSFLIGLLVVICVSIAFEKILGNVSLIANNFTKIKNIVVGVLAPFIYGFFLAFLLNSFLKPIEKWLKRFKIKEKTRRLISALVTYIILFGIIGFIIYFLVPALRDNIKPIIELVTNLISKYSYLLEEPLNNFLSSDLNLNRMLKEFNTIFNTDFYITDIFGSVAAIPNFLNRVLGLTLNLLLGTVISFYVLMDKESILENIRRSLYAFIKNDYADKFIYFINHANIVFEKFIVGKFIDSTIIAIMFFAGGAFLNLPFLAINTLLIGISNMIPYFGPFLGAGPVLALVLLNDILQEGVGVSRTIWTALFIFILQQIDGIIIGPKILGDSTGLKPIGVIFSIIVGGALGGVLGMFLGVPIFALIKTLFYAFIEKKYNKNVNEGGM